MSKIYMPEFGVFGCECVAKSLPLLQTVMLIREDIASGLDVFQGCYNTGVGASAGTHDKGGCVDIGQYADRHLRTARTFGWCAQHRTPAQGFDPHNHMFPNGCPHMSPLANSQQWAWNQGRNGLVSNGPVTGPGPKGTDTPNWKTGVKRMETEIMTFADDVAKKTADRVLAGMKSSGATPAELWAYQISINDKEKWSAAHILSWLMRAVGGLWKSDIIPAPTPDPKNPNWTPSSYLRETLLAVRAQDKKISSLAADVTALKNKGA